MSVTCRFGRFGDVVVISVVTGLLVMDKPLLQFFDDR